LLLSQGALAISDEASFLKALRERLQVEHQPPEQKVEAREPLLLALARRPHSAEELAEGLRLSLGEVAAKLLEYELSGVISRVAGYYRLQDRR
jgi:predicted Rossmann fold nucleotide-binding protein DprA/Smf involved in DNA uptake